MAHWRAGSGACARRTARRRSQRFAADLATLVRHSKAIEALGPAKTVPSKLLTFEWLDNFARRQEQIRSGSSGRLDD
jgi:hypothetical protein